MPLVCRNQGRHRARLTRATRTQRISGHGSLTPPPLQLLTDRSLFHLRILPEPGHPPLNGQTCNVTTRYCRRHRLTHTPATTTWFLRHHTPHTPSFRSRRCCRITIIHGPLYMLICVCPQHSHVLLRMLLGVHIPAIPAPRTCPPQYRGWPTTHSAMQTLDTPGSKAQEK